MSYYSTNNKLVGRYRITKHALSRFKERYGDEYIGNKKIKNMNGNKARRKIIKSLKERNRKIKKQKDGTLVAITKDFKAIINPSFDNVVITII